MCWKTRELVCQEHVDYDLLNEEARATHRGLAGSSPGTGALPLRKSENPEVLLMEGAVSVYSYKGSRVTRFITLGRTEQSTTSQGKGSPLCPGLRPAGEREQGGKHLILTCKVAGVEVTSFSWA